MLSDPPAPEKTGHLPAGTEFPREPATWYLLCTSANIKTKPCSKDILGKRLVAFRASQGEVAVLDARCAHLSADLGLGTVVGDTIRCPFHHWSYSTAGKCVHVPGCEQPPGFAMQRRYPAVERHGFVYFFNGPEPLFPLPFFPDCTADQFVASASFQFEVDSPWYMLVANGFDCQHFQAVHDRQLVSEPVVDTPTEFSRRIRFRAQVAGDTIFDRLLRRFVGKVVEISITSWGGPHVLVEGQFGRAHSRLLIASQMYKTDHTLSHVIVFARRSSTWQGGSLADEINLRVRRRFTRAFMQYDTDRLRGVRYQPASLIPQDHEMLAFFYWLTRLPRSEYESGR